ncbi:hypothetical protein FACS1894110_21660 [Spirochaetia bacterium]|nr:hypothetical protein FACS1894110_21660 [Spirochaetia bacterium]
MYHKLQFQRNLAVTLLLFAFLFPLYGRDLPTRKIEDDSSLRISLRDDWFTAVPSFALNQRPQVHILSGGGSIQVRVEAARDEFAVVLARESDRAGTYPGWAQGSWILTRRRDTGEASRIRVFPRSDPYTYVQFRPLSNDKCLMDVVLYEAYVVRSQPLPIPFERLLSMPVEEIFSIAGNKFPRRYFEPDADNYRDLRLFMGRVRERLGELEFQDDGAFDENGNYVFIETLGAQKEAPGLNCSGFAKWVVDGILRPLTGKRLPVPPLKQPFGNRGSSFTELWEESRDPFFGLDWTRNLASSAMTVLRSPAYAKLEEFEVRNWPFSQVILRNNISNAAGGSPGTPTGTSVRAYPGFLEDSGFGFEGLHPLLYTLAIDEPGRIYLASINTEMGVSTTMMKKDDNAAPASVSAGNAPRIRQYFHIAVLVPYFREDGNFDVAVFESAEETMFSSFKTRYPDHYINLVRIPVEGQFDP